jgi:hypothetical protein
MNKDGDLTTEISLALLRAHNGKPTAGLYKEVRSTSGTEMMLSKSKEISFFKSNRAKELIGILGWPRNPRCMNDVIFHKFVDNPRHYLTKTRDDPNFFTRLFTFNSNGRITSSDGCFQEKSIIIRMIYCLMGINPYANLEEFTGYHRSQLDSAFQKIDFESGKLINHMQQALEKFLYEDPVHYKFEGGSKNYDAYNITKQLEIIKAARQAIRSKFMTMAIKAIPFPALANMTDFKYLDMDYGVIDIQHILEVWGGSEKAYKNGVFKDNFPLPYFLSDHRNMNLGESKYLKGSEKDVFVVNKYEAHNFLESKGISCSFVSNQKAYDYSYFIFDKFFEAMNNRFTLSNAKKVLSHLLN